MTLTLADHRPPAPTRTPDAPEDQVLQKLQTELAGYRGEMESLRSYEPREVFERLSAWHARAHVMRATTYLRETRRSSAFRSHEIDPFLEACEFQFKSWSRIQATNEADLRMARGGF